MEPIKQPHSIEVETAVLSRLILSNVDRYKAVEQLQEESFYDLRHREVFKLIKELIDNKIEIGYVSLQDRAINKGLIPHQFDDNFIFNLYGDKYYLINIMNYVKMLQDYHKRRKMLETAHNLIQKANDGNADIVVETGLAIQKLTQDISKGKKESSAESAIASLREQIEKHRASSSKYLGNESGLEELDKKLDGIRDGHFGVLTGYTSAGKTALAMNIVSSFIKKGKKVVIFSLEMSPAQLVARLAGIISGVPIWVISKGEMNQAQSKSVGEAMELIKNSGLEIYEDPSLQSIEMTILKESADKRTSLFVLDYLGLVQSGMSNDYQGLKHIAQKFQSIMKSFNVHLIALSQINDAQIKDDNPFVISTKGSGDIGASADYVLRLKNKEANLDVISQLKDSKVPLPIQLYIQKNRHGPTGVINLYFHTDTNRFEDESTYDPSLYTTRINIIKSKTGDGLDKEFDIKS